MSSITQDGHREYLYCQSTIIRQAAELPNGCYERIVLRDDNFMAGLPCPIDTCHCAAEIGELDAARQVPDRYCFLEKGLCHSPQLLKRGWYCHCVSSSSNNTKSVPLMSKFIQDSTTFLFTRWQYQIFSSAIVENHSVMVGK